ncbi:MAG: DUF1704 domain-containing protein [Acidimicrobiia bacterium]|nr:DUF1704 domain-containing protein [Acidimicrobiia bacterium]
MAKATTVRLDDALIGSVGEQLRHNRAIRRTLPPDGRLNIDRQLPFIFVYRPGPDGPDQAFARVMTGGASYLVAPSPKRTKGWTNRLILEVAETLSGLFGAFLLIELWPSSAVSAANGASTLPRPAFKLRYGRAAQGSPAVERLASSLERVVVMKQKATLEHVIVSKLAPQSMPPLLSPANQRRLEATIVSLEIEPVYNDPTSGDVLPLVGQALARQVSRALQQAAFDFAQAETNDRSIHYHALGRRTFVAAAKKVDAGLTEVANSFDLLLSVTPVNTEAAYRRFRRRNFESPPRFLYRPTTVDPDLLKRQLWNIPIERVEDLVLDQVFREKRRELDLKLTLISERERQQFLPTSMALYGRMDANLRATAASILEELPALNDTLRTRKVGARDFITRAEAELDRLRDGTALMGAKVVVRNDVSSLMVSSGNLIVGADMSFPANRVEPLIQHEVGTHVLTYWNGRAQPFQLLATGLAGHDELQEGLAVFVEYLVGGLTSSRLRTLAARVLAVCSLLEGATFIDTFRVLHDDYGLSARNAFMVSMRVHRGGGLTKDAVYLRGLEKVVEYLAKGGRLDTLFVGKIATQHASVIEELQRRQVLEPPPFRPSYLDQPDAHYRIERIRDNPRLTDLADA